VKISAAIVALVFLLASALGVLWYAERAAHRRTDARRIALEARASLRTWQDVERDAARWRVFVASELGDDQDLAAALATRAGLTTSAEPDHAAAAQRALEAGLATAEAQLGAPLAFACLLDPAGRVVAAVTRIEGLPDDLAGDAAASRALSYGTSSDGLERYGEQAVLTAAAPVVYDGRLVVGAVLAGVTLASALDPSVVLAAEGLPGRLTVGREGEVIWSSLPPEQAEALPWDALASEPDAVHVLVPELGGGIAVAGTFRGVEGDAGALQLVLTLPDDRLPMGAGAFAARAGDLSVGSWAQWLPLLLGAVLLLATFGIAGFERHKLWERAFKAGQEAEHRTMRVAYPTDELAAPSTGEVEAYRDPTPPSQPPAAGQPGTAQLATAPAAPASPAALAAPAAPATRPRPSPPVAATASVRAPSGPRGSAGGGKILRAAKPVSPARPKPSPAGRPQELVLERTSAASQERIAVDADHGITPPPGTLGGDGGFEIERLGAVGGTGDFEIERTDGRVERISGSHAPPPAITPATSPEPARAAAAPTREPSGIYIGVGGGGGGGGAGGGYAHDDLDDRERRALLAELFGEAEADVAAARAPRDHHDARLEELLGGYDEDAATYLGATGARNRERTEGARPTFEAEPSPGSQEYYQQVFREFLDARRRCNQPVEGLGFDAFLERVKKKKDDFKARYDCDSVELEVYVRDGKAGLKAKRPRAPF
jgi:hypothetical protein